MASWLSPIVCHVDMSCLLATVQYRETARPHSCVTAHGEFLETADQRTIAVPRDMLAQGFAKGVAGPSSRQASRRLTFCRVTLRSDVSVTMRG